MYYIYRLEQEMIMHYYVGRLVGSYDDVYVSQFCLCLYSSSSHLASIDTEY